MKRRSPLLLLKAAGKPKTELRTSFPSGNEFFHCCTLFLSYSSSPYCYLCLPLLPPHAADIIPFYSQRAFRERKERQVKELKPKLNNLEVHSSTLLTNSERVIPSPYSPAEWSMDDKTRSYHSPCSVHDQPVIVRHVATRTVATKTVTYARTKGAAKEKANPDLTLEEAVNNKTPATLDEAQGAPFSPLDVNLDGSTVVSEGVPIAKVVEGSPKDLARRTRDEEEQLWADSVKLVDYELDQDNDHEAEDEGSSTSVNNHVVIKNGLINDEGGKGVVEGGSKYLTKRAIDEDGDIINMQGDIKDHVKRWEKGIEDGDLIDPQDSEPYDSSFNYGVGFSTRESGGPEEAASTSLTMRFVPQPRKVQRVTVQLPDGRLNRREGKIVSFLLRPFRLLGIKLSILKLTVPESFTNGNASGALEFGIESSFYLMAYYGILSSVSVALTLFSNIIFFITPKLKYDRCYRYLDKYYRLLATIFAWGILGNEEEGGEVLERIKLKQPTGYFNEITKLFFIHSVNWWALNVLITVGPIITSSLQHLTLRESQLEEGKVRIRYRCQCGKQIFGDYQELRPGAAAEWQERLENHFGEKCTTSNSAESSGRSGKISNTLKSLFDFLTFQGRENASSDTSALPLASTPSTPDPSQRPISQAPTSLKFLLLCIKHEKWAIKLKHANACSITSDVQLFRILASEYRAARRRSLLSMRKLGSIKFLRFEALQKAETIGVRKVPDYPPEDNIDYDYKPRPMDLLPPISENEMIHYFHCPDHALDIPLFLERMPLKLNGRLDLSSGANTGWGIIFNDSISWKKVWMMAFIGMLSSALAGLSWWFIKDDAQGGSVIAGVTAPIVLVTIGAIQGYLGEID